VPPFAVERTSFLANVELINEIALLSFVERINTAEPPNDSFTILPTKAQPSNLIVELAAQLLI